MQELSALGLLNPVQKTSRIIKAHSQPNSLAIWKFILLNCSCIESPGGNSEAFNNYFSTTLITDNPSHSEIHLMLSLVKLSAISIDVAGIMTETKCATLDGLIASHQSCFEPLVQIFLCFFFKNSCFPCLALLSRHSWRAPISFYAKKGAIHDPENFRPIIHSPDVSKLMKDVLQEQLVNFLTIHSLITPSQRSFLGVRFYFTFQFDFLNHVIGLLILTCR